MSHLERLRAMVRGEIPPPPVADLIGMRITAAAPGEVTFELDAGPQHTSPLGTPHGGILCDVADAAMGCAHLTNLADDETFTTLELKMSYLKPVWEGRLRADARVLKAGRTIGLVECRVTDEASSLVAFGTATQMTLRGEAARGR
jgi:uncharacterized protein (TIGR00369 family)